MSTDVPTQYEDLGKSARDIFSKGFGELCGVIVIPFDVVYI
jgi:hypothetical protein